MSKSYPFPAIAGGCRCGGVRYRMETAPLYCYACHCLDCQKSTGSAFLVAATIEEEYITLIGKIVPQIVPIYTNSTAVCPVCKAAVWTLESRLPGILNIRVGTLDLPGLMVPDIHVFVDSKVAWVTLPKGAKICRGYLDRSKVWPRSSLARLDAHQARLEAQKLKQNAQVDGDECQADDTTPTARSPDDEEGDEDLFEKQQDEIERVLQERLEKLELKLCEQENS